ncbi:chemotaxis regulator, protein-glutamate methyltransferase [Enterobacter cancerogenus]|uniref:CheR family methyltransferase n=1 Tax=Enterobacter cancerogenus TaxID=69218 RepID=UPI0019281CE0|nr:CheR family methyltransferase [Enterobacter cancerogenus]CAD5358423.1 chemotaxis regulator, protein-glutamate methyltransferase [Enterobacter cancerogenus]
MQHKCPPPNAVENIFSFNAKLSDRELEKISQLIYQRVGIVLTEQKRDMIYNRLSRRLRELKINDFSSYLAQLEASTNNSEWQIFINSLTTNLTSFFRESYHFPILAEHAQQRGGNYSVWCTSTSSGEEACSVAITLEEALGRSSIGPRVWATDVDTEVLNKAIAGVYRLSDLDNLSQEYKKRYFLRGTGTQHQLVKVRKELLDSIHYQHLNLMDAIWDIPPQFDAIFCRNVMIYFDKQTQERLLARFARQLKPGGMLFVGHSEHFAHTGSPFHLRGQSVYSLSREK